MCLIDKGGRENNNYAESILQLHAVRHEADVRRLIITGDIHHVSIYSSTTLIFLRSCRCCPFLVVRRRASVDVGLHVNRYGFGHVMQPVAGLADNNGIERFAACCRSCRQLVVAYTPTRACRIGAICSRVVRATS